MDIVDTSWYKKWKSEPYITESQYLKELHPPTQTITSDLEILSRKLFDLLPDYSIGPEERVERLARVIPESILESKNMMTARSKLKNIQTRLDELVPDIEGYENKIDYLVDLASKLSPYEMEEDSLIKKLEELDDFRRTDNGRRF